MNRIIFFLASMIAAVTFASQASALPLFARQTGMECAACHFQHFPVLNAFGRAFKASGFTMMGAQGKVEGERLSIPNTLNMAVLTTAGYTKTNANGNGTPDGVRNPGDGAVYVPGTNGEFSLFVGGRASDNVGALAELGMLQDAGKGASLSSAKLPMLWDVAADTRAGVVPFTTGGQGASYGYEVLNTGANAVHTMLFIGGDANGSVAPVLSAQQYLGTGVAATGAAFVVNSSMGFINLTKFNQMGPADLGGTGAALTSTYLRAAGTFDLVGWDTGVGIQSWSGSSTSLGFAENAAINGTSATVIPATGGGTVPAVPAYNAPVTLTPSPTLMETKAWAIDGQMQNTLANNMPVGIYATYARAPAPSAGGIDNAYNSGGTATRSSFNLAVELGVIPEKATVGFGIRRGKSGSNAGSGVAGANDSDNAWLLEGSYKLAQNIMLNLVYTSQSGGFWTTNSGGTGTIDTIGSKQTTINLATIF